MIKAKVSTYNEPLDGVAVEVLITTPNGETVKLELTETEVKNCHIQQFFKIVLSSAVQFQFQTILKLSARF